MYAKDPFRFTRCHFDVKRRDLYIFREFNSYKMRNKDVFDALYDDLKLVGRDEQVIADSAEPKSIDDFKAYGAFIRGAEKGPQSRRYSMKWLQGLSHIYIDKKHCPNTYWEFVNYEYETDRDGNFLSDYPDGNDHGIDACITSDTLIRTLSGTIPIGEIPTSGVLYAYDIFNNAVVETPYCNCHKTRENAEIWEITLDNCNTIKCTYDHKILTANRAYIIASELTADDEVVCVSWDNRVWSGKVQSVIKTSDREDVYDLEVPKYHNFIANDMVIHNCRYSLEKFWKRKGN